MIIRDAQMAQLRGNLADRFLARLMAQLRSDLAEEVSDLDDDALRVQVGHAVRCADSYGLCTEADQASFTMLAAAFGWEFDRRDEWVRQYLSDPLLTPAQRLARVSARCLQILARAARSEAAHVAFEMDA